jgi:hypothetical protein
VSLLKVCVFSIDRNIRSKVKYLMKTLNIEEYTYKRLTSVLKEIMHEKRRDVNYDDVINELIDIYQQNSWDHFGAAAGGG